MSRTFNEIFPCDVVDVQGKAYLFTNARVDRESIPEGLYAYDVGDDCDGNFWRVQRFVMVNHWGTIIGPEEVALDAGGQFWCEAEDEDGEYSSEGAYISYAESLEDFLSSYEGIVKDIRREV